MTLLVLLVLAAAPVRCNEGQKEIEGKCYRPVPPLRRMPAGVAYCAEGQKSNGQHGIHLVCYESVKEKRK